MTQLYQSKIFANGSTTLPKPVRDALGVTAGDHIRFVISDDGVQVLRVSCVSEMTGMLSPEGQETVSLGAMQDAIVSGATESVK